MPVATKYILASIFVVVVLGFILAVRKVRKATHKQGLITPAQLKKERKEKMIPVKEDDCLTVQVSYRDLV